MFDILCTYPLSSDLFAQDIHPTAPILALGLASGHVQLNRLPSSDPATISPAGCSAIETAWRTRRHKGSCRSLCYSHDGSSLYSAGTDGLVKSAATETGQVAGKIAVPLHNNLVDPTTLIQCLTPQTFLLATDSSALYVYDFRANSTTIAAKPQQIYHPHDDYVSSLTPLPPTDASTSGVSKQWVSTGGTTVAVTDLRRGTLVKSEDQGEELLSSTIVNDKLVIGGEKGGLRFWKVGVWDDDEETINVGKGASADILATAPESVGREQMLTVGMDDGYVRIVGMGGKRPKVLGEVSHDEVEGVLGLGFEVGGRMCSGGGSVVKVWEEKRVEVEEEEEQEEAGVNGKRNREPGSEQDDSEAGRDESEEEHEEEEKPKKRKKKKRSKGKGKANGQGQHTMAFTGLD